MLPEYFDFSFFSFFFSIIGTVPLIKCVFSTVQLLSLVVTFCSFSNEYKTPDIDDVRENK